MSKFFQHISGRAYTIIGKVNSQRSTLSSADIVIFGGPLRYFMELESSSGTAELAAFFHGDLWQISMSNSALLSIIAARKFVSTHQ